ncbi:MAG: SDR family NAD(P)-dependent oxidoreductase [Alphaproteobacteria bacterium]
MSDRMYGKTVMVTGATDGIGLVTARELSGMGARVLLVGRNQQKGAASIAAIKHALPGADLVFLQADLSQQSEIIRLARMVSETESKLDVLVNNAGGIFSHRQESADGIELSFALNHLNYFLLTLEMLDLLRAAPAARIVNVASRAHVGAELDFADLQFKNGYHSRNAYRRSKLCNIMFTRALARRLEGSTITTNALHPGFVRTAFGGAGNPFYFRWAVKALMLATAISVEEGAKTSIHLASSPKLEGVSGLYFAECKEVKATKAARDDVTGERLWQVSEEMVRGAA